MITGVRFKAYPTVEQKITLSQWMGCARFIWNAKCDEHKYLYQFAKKYLPTGTYAPIDQSFAQYKSKELSPWLYHCPSQILRNSASNWYKTCKNFMKGACGKPKRKKRDETGSVHLTREIFHLEQESPGKWKLFIGQKNNNIGYLRFNAHRSFKETNSIYIRKDHGKYFVSFCYENDQIIENQATLRDHFDYLQTCSKEHLEEICIGIDRGVKRPLQVGNVTYDFTSIAKAKKASKDSYIKRMQKKLSKQKKGSNRRNKTKRKIRKAHRKIADIRNDFCHKASRSIVSDETKKVFILENLQTASMTKASLPKQENGKYVKNGKKAKSGLNKSILDTSWNRIETYISYKATWAGKAVFKISPYQTSQECADCGHTHPENRKKQDLFLCVHCGLTENADVNAAHVIKKRAINCFLNSGTELSSKGVLLDIGRGAKGKTPVAKATDARGQEASKKRDQAAVAA